MNVTIWHNPRCTKSRATLALLQDRGLTPDVRLYLDDAPGADEIITVAGLLGVPVSGFVRTGESVFKDLGLGKDDSDAKLAAAMAANPALIERPIVITNGKAAIGRPPEAVLDIL